MNTLHCTSIVVSRLRTASWCFLSAASSFLDSSCGKKTGRIHGKIIDYQPTDGPTDGRPDGKELVIKVLWFIQIGFVATKNQECILIRRSWLNTDRVNNDERMNGCRSGQRDGQADRLMRRMDRWREWGKKDPSILGWMDMRSWGQEDGYEAKRMCRQRNGTTRGQTDEGGGERNGRREMGTRPKGRMDIMKKGFVDL